MSWRKALVISNNQDMKMKSSLIVIIRTPLYIRTGHVKTAEQRRGEHSRTPMLAVSEC